MSPEINYNIFIWKGAWSDNPIDAEVNQELSSPWTAQFKMTTDSTLNLGVGNTIHIMIWQGSNEHLVFSGIIEKRNIIYPEGLLCPYVEYDAKSKAPLAMQNNYIYKEIPEGQATLQIYGVVMDLIPGTLSAFSSNYTSPNFPAFNKQNNYWDFVSDICDKADWDFYIDQGDTLHAFPRGAFLSSLVIDSSDNVIELKLEEDASNIINYQEVVGGDYKTSIIPINTVDWSSNGSASTLTKDDRLCIRGSITTGELFLKYTYPSIQNLLFSSNLRLGVEYYSDTSNPPPLIIKYSCFSDSSNYFYKDVSLPGGENARNEYLTGPGGPAYVSGGYYIKPWQDQKVLMWFDPDWSEVGSPKWSSISALEVRAISPLGNYNQLYLSALTISSYVTGIFQSSTSQGSFGMRRGKQQFDTNYRSAEMCIIAASLIVTAFKSPLLSAGEVPTAYNFDYNPGERATLSLLDHTEVYEVRKIRHEYEDNRLKTYLSLETKFKYSIEDILDFYKKSLSIVGWDLERWKQKTTETGLIDTRSGLIDWSQIEEMFPFYEWINMKNVIGMGEGLDGYEFNTGNTPGYASVSAGGKFDILFGGYDLHGWLASKKKTVPWNKNLMLKFELKYPANTIVGYGLMNLKIGVDSWAGGDSYAQFNFLGNDGLYFRAGTFSAPDIATSLNLGAYTPGEIHRLEWRYMCSIPIFYAFIDETYKGSLVPTYWNTLTTARPISFYSQINYTTLEVYAYKLSQPWG